MAASPGVLTRFRIPAAAPAVASQRLPGGCAAAACAQAAAGCRTVPAAMTRRSTDVFLCMLLHPTDPAEPVSVPAWPAVQTVPGLSAASRRHGARDGTGRDMTGSGTTGSGFVCVIPDSIAVLMLRTDCVRARRWCGRHRARRGNGYRAHTVGPAFLLTKKKGLKTARIILPF
jgi:hypothetical protein